MRPVCLAALACTLWLLESITSLQIISLLSSYENTCTCDVTDHPNWWGQPCFTATVSGWPLMVVLTTHNKVTAARTQFVGCNRQYFSSHHAFTIWGTWLVKVHAFLLWRVPVIICSQLAFLCWLLFPFFPPIYSYWNWFYTAKNQPHWTVSTVWYIH